MGWLSIDSEAFREWDEKYVALECDMFPKLGAGLSWVHTGGHGHLSWILMLEVSGEALYYEFKW